jgi:galactokinase
MKKFGEIMNERNEYLKKEYEVYWMEMDEMVDDELEVDGVMG